MRKTKNLIALSLAGVVSATGCATAHLNGEYAPNYLATGGTVTNTSEKTTLAEGNDWVFFWGLIEVASSDLGNDVTNRVHPGVVLTDTEVRNHISLPGTLLWLITAGIVSHHDLDLRGRIATIEPRPSEQPVVIVPGTVTGVAPERKVILEGERFAETTIDRPYADVAGEFNDAALRNGLLPIAEVTWDSYSDEHRNEIPRDRLSGVPASKVRTFVVTTGTMAQDASREPRCAANVPGVVVYESAGRTNVIYARPTTKLRELDACGKVGDGKLMTRTAFDEHMAYARDFEREIEATIESLRKTPRKS